MRLRNLSLRWKTAIPIILFISVGVLITIIFTGYKTKSIVFDEIRHSALDGIRDTVLNALTTMMFTGNYAGSKEQFLEQMSRIADVRVVRARSMDADFPPGKGKAPHYPSGPIEQEVVEKGVARVSVEGDSIHAVYPYLAGSNIMGKNCLTCHKAKEGEAIGAVSIRIPIGESLGRIRSLQYLYVAFGIAGVGGMTVLVLGIVGFALRPLKAFLEEMQALGRNYSVAELSEQKGDEVSRVAETVKNVTRRLNTMITGIMVSTSKLLPVIDILKDVVEKTTRGAKRQSEEAAQIAASAEEMNQTIGDIAKNASIAADTSTGALKIASGGKERADSAIGEVKDVKRSTVELAGMVEQLNSRVGEIGDIVTVIKDIADQTNLLALNAAIEAARAGEQGRGFAVVADEVRKLAERTIKATAEISEKIHRVQEESEHTAHSMEGAAQKSTAAADRIGSIGEALEAVLAETRKVQDQVARIATAVEEQSSTTGEITRNIESTSSIAADIEKMSGRVLAEVMKLTAAADEIRTTTAGVKTRGGALVMLELAKSDHKGFVERLSSCLKGETTMEAAKLPDHHSCRFGKWYDKEGLQLCGGMSSFTALETPHSRMHQLAKQAVEAHNAGDERKAEQVFREVAEASARIMELLEKAKTECAQADN